MSDFQELIGILEIESRGLEDETLAMILDRELMEIKMLYLSQDHVKLAILATKYCLTLRGVIK
jgi:hypothetical protein